MDRIRSSQHMRTMDPPAELARTSAIVGVGETNYGTDYAAWRTRDPAYVAPSLQELTTLAFERALADSGLVRDDIDGLIEYVGYGGMGAQPVANLLGLTPRFGVTGSVPMPLGLKGEGAVPTAVRALATGLCETVAIVYATASRTAGRVFGGETHVGTGRDSYYYYHPWGWSSQAAHWALMCRAYMEAFGTTETDLGHVAVVLRDHAVRNENAIMRSPLTIEDYLASPYIVRPLRRLDLCIPNDGGVCLILRRADAADHRHAPVVIAGWSNAATSAAKMHHLVKDRLQTLIGEAGASAFRMADLSLDDVGHFQGYDASTFHLINQLEAYGFVEPGHGFEFCGAGEMGLSGRLPTNTSGGLLSEAYMHGWNHLVEATRQLRHEAGDRQVPGLEASIFSMVTTDTAHPVLLVRGR